MLHLRPWQGLTAGVGGVVGSDRPRVLLNVASGLSPVDISPLSLCGDHRRRTSQASGNCECSGATARSPEHSLPDMPSLGPRGTESSGATVHGPERSLLELTVRVLGEPSARGPLFTAPSTLSRN